MRQGARAPIGLEGRAPPEGCSHCFWSHRTSSRALALGRVLRADGGRGCVGARRGLVGGRRHARPRATRLPRVIAGPAPAAESPRGGGTPAAPPHRRFACAALIAEPTRILLISANASASPLLLSRPARGGACIHRGVVGQAIDRQAARCPCPRPFAACAPAPLACLTSTIAPRRLAHELIMAYDLSKHLTVCLYGEHWAPLSPQEFTRFHTDAYVKFLQQVTPRGTPPAFKRWHVAGLTLPWRARLYSWSIMASTSSTRPRAMPSTHPYASASRHGEPTQPPPPWITTAAPPSRGQNPLAAGAAASERVRARLSQAILADLCRRLRRGSTEPLPGRGRCRDALAGRSNARAAGLRIGVLVRERRGARDAHAPPQV